MREGQREKGKGCKNKNKRKGLEVNEERIKKGVETETWWRIAFGFLKEEGEAESEWTEALKNTRREMGWERRFKPLIKAALGGEEGLSKRTGLTERTAIKALREASGGVLSPTFLMSASGGEGDWWVMAELPNGKKMFEEGDSSEATERAVWRNKKELSEEMSRMAITWWAAGRVESLKVNVEEDEEGLLREMLRRGERLRMDEESKEGKEKGRRRL